MLIGFSQLRVICGLVTFPGMPIWRDSEQHIWRQPRHPRREDSADSADRPRFETDEVCYVSCTLCLAFRPAHTEHVHGIAGSLKTTLCSTLGLLSSRLAGFFLLPCCLFTFLLAHSSE